MWITLYSCSPDASIILSHPHLHDPHTLTHVCSTLVTSLVVTNISYFTLTVYSRRRALGGRESERNSERCAEYLATARPHLAPQLPPPPPSPQHLTGALCPLPTAAPALLGARVALPRPTATRLPPRHHQRPTGAAPPHHTAARARTSGRPAQPLPRHCSGGSAAPVSCLAIAAPPRCGSALAASPVVVACQVEDAPRGEPGTCGRGRRRVSRARALTTASHSSPHRQEAAAVAAHGESKMLRQQ